MTCEFTFYVGVDWATEHHQVRILDCDGRVVQQQSIEHSGKAITDFMASMEDLAQAQVDWIAVAIEVPGGPVVEAFLEHRWAVFAINPKQLEVRYWPPRGNAQKTLAAPRR